VKEMFIIYLLSGYYYLLQGNESQVPFGGVIQYVTTDFVQAQLILNALIGALPPPPPPAAAYKLYVATMTQAAADAPITDELENTVGAVTWVRDSLGNYSAPLVLAAGETFWVGGRDSGGICCVPISKGAGLDYFYLVGWFANTIFLAIYDTLTYSSQEFSAIIGAKILNLPEVRIYPA